MAEQVKMEMASSSSVAAKPSSLPAMSYHPYPQPLARYEDVVVSRELFMDTLGKLHATMETKFMIPVIGGKNLDLHRLFIEVTSRGGIWRILNEKRWKEVTAIFSFPSSATNASFILRKYYLSLLQHYEQIYYFKAKGWTESSDDLHNVPTVTASSKRLDASLSPSIVQEPTLQSHKITAQPLSGGSPAPFTVVGVIDGKFESGYLVTVTIGSETLKGVLYQTPKNADGQVTPNHSTSKTIDNLPTTTGVQRRRRRKKCEMKKRDPAHPKPNRSGYNFFFAEQHARLKPLYPGKDRDISRMIGDLWNKLNEAGKVVYQEKAVKDKERYRIEMGNYREMLKTAQVISNVLPIQQQPLGIDINMIDADGKIEAEGGDSPQTPETELSSGNDDRSKLDNINADGDNVMVKAYGVEIKAETVGVGSLVDKKAVELHNGVVKNGQGLELMEADNQMESQKKSAPATQ
ncbi:High mobility group B protein 15 [Heracleum sosnowskyi]|uniref:High mobility group B protein 15 n=1 Tax=Heracleum sosnowskyi TaxID=360622 RepID=A0AAD8IRD2_9APIA|nr:High mobility group B protein 15 [Heracleum sosnowskyi]